MNIAEKFIETWKTLTDAADRADYMQEGVGFEVNGRKFTVHPKPIKPKIQTWNVSVKGKESFWSATEYPAVTLGECHRNALLEAQRVFPATDIQSITIVRNPLE